MGDDARRGVTGDSEELEALEEIRRRDAIARCSINCNLRSKCLSRGLSCAGDKKLSWKEDEEGPEGGGSWVEGEWVGSHLDVQHIIATWLEDMAQGDRNRNGARIFELDAEGIRQLTERPIGPDPDEAARNTRSKIW